MERLKGLEGWRRRRFGLEEYWSCWMEETFESLNLVFFCLWVKIGFKEVWEGKGALKRSSIRMSVFI